MGSCSARVDPAHECCLPGCPLGCALLEGTDLRLKALQGREFASHGAILGLGRAIGVAPPRRGTCVRRHVLRDRIRSPNGTLYKKESA